MRSLINLQFMMFAVRKYFDERCRFCCFKKSSRYLGGVSTIDNPEFEKRLKSSFGFILNFCQKVQSRFKNMYQTEYLTRSSLAIYCTDY